MNSVVSCKVDISVVLGRSRMPIHQLLKMGRGAVIELDTIDKEEVYILANNTPVAKGEVIMQGEQIAVNITEKISSDEIAGCGSF